MIAKRKRLNFNLEKARKKRVLVIGDLMVDRYIHGMAHRISPEAPVPVFCYKGEACVAGGASNVANNLIGLGIDVSIAGVVGKDSAGKWLIDDMASKHVSTTGIYYDDNRPTTIKTRYTEKGYQLLRVDRENTNEIHVDAQHHIFNHCCRVIPDTDAVILSDYVKGVLSDSDFVRKVIKLCDKNNTLVLADTKSRNPSKFKDVSIITPNVDEVTSAVGIQADTREKLDTCAQKYLEISGAKILVLTRGDKGISVYQKNKKCNDYPAKDVEVFDVSGAGDTVMATITAGLLAGMDLETSVILANYAAGVVIQKRGTAAITYEELKKSIE